jgi:hypothetical protein
MIDILSDVPILGKFAFASQLGAFASMAWLGWNTLIHTPWSAINVLLVMVAFDETLASLPLAMLIVAAGIAEAMSVVPASPLLVGGVLLWGLAAGVCGALARAVAVVSRKRAATLVGVAFGPIGVIVAALMPPDRPKTN